MDHPANTKTNCLTNLLLHESDYGVPINWNFFATSHGRENDGIVSDVKTTVQRTSNESDGDEFRGICNSGKGKIPIVYYWREL